MAGVNAGVAGSVLKRVRARLATEAGAPDPRQRQYAVLVAVAVVGATALGWIFDLHTPGIVAGVTAVFALVATSGQALRSDLHRFVWFTPALALVMTLGPVLSNVPVLAGIAVASVVFGAGMLPAMGEHYRVGGDRKSVV